MTKLKESRRNNRCQADVTYTVSSHKKAAYRLTKYLDAAGATQVLHEIAGQIEVASADKIDVNLNNENWTCRIFQSPVDLGVE